MSLLSVAGTISLLGRHDPYSNFVTAFLPLESDIIDKTGRIWTPVGTPTFNDGEAVLNHSNYIYSDQTIGTQPLTIEYFVTKIENISGGYSTGILKWGSASEASDGFGVEYFKQNGGLTHLWYRKSYSGLTGLSANVVSTKYHHAFVYDGDNCYMFINGEKISVPTPNNFGTSRRLSFGIATGLWKENKNKKNKWHSHN